MGRYIVDIYDLNFKMIGEAFFFNWIRRNLAQIVDGKLYIPSIDNYDGNIMRRLGGLCLSIVAEKLNISPILNQ